MVQTDPGLETLELAWQLVAEVAIGMGPQAVLEFLVADLQRLALPILVQAQLPPADPDEGRLEAAQLGFLAGFVDQLGIAPDSQVSRILFQYGYQP